ncbi:MAG: right-handed parallel beta-helix repeat-containing protein [Methylovirgula sp.]
MAAALLGQRQNMDRRWLLKSLPFVLGAGPALWTTAARAGDPAYYCETNDMAVVVSAAVTKPGPKWSRQTLQQAIEIAQRARKPLNILPGTYSANQLVISQPIEIYGAPGTMILPSNSSCVNVTIDSVDDVIIRGIAFSGKNLPFAAPAGGSLSPLPAMGEYGRIPNFNGIIAAHRVERLRIEDCTIGGSSACGVALWNCRSAQIRGNQFADNMVAIYSTNGADNLIADNTIQRSGDGGIIVWQTPANFDGTIIRGNHVDVTTALTTSTRTEVGGSGYFGNGIYGWQANNLIISENVCTQSTFSGIRLFNCYDCNVSNNQIVESGETALMIEAPYGSKPGPVVETPFTTVGPANPHYEGAAVSGNVVVGAGNGITITNVWTGGRRVTINGNQVKSVKIFTMRTSDPQNPSYLTGGTGIAAEGDVVVNGNMVEDCEGPGILLYDVGVEGSSFETTASAVGNTVKNAPIGIGFHQQWPGETRHPNFILIEGNILQGYTQGSIMAIIWTFDSHGNVNGYTLADGKDWGRTAQGAAYVGKPYPNVAIGPNYALGA